MDKKKRILWIGEYSNLATGYGVYAKELLSRLFATQKYEIAELGCFGTPEDPGIPSIPWKYYPNLPKKNDQQGWADYDSEALNKFGYSNFEAVCLDFMPDIVISIRDPWMDDLITRSPYRKCFHHFYMAPIDCVPQKDLWLNQYIDVDCLFTYTDWSKKEFQKITNNRVKVYDVAPPGANFDFYKPQESRDEFNIEDDTLIVGTVMRNQTRKLYPDLIEAMQTFYKTAPKNLADRTYVYLHTGYPDIGWDIPSLIKNSGISNKFLFTYICNSCKHFFPGYFQDAKTVCRKCGRIEARLCNTNLHLSSKDLGKIINLFDIYVQYATNEGMGMPQIEAAACGVPIMAPYYSAMVDAIDKLDGIPIDIKRYYTDQGTHGKRALPDNQDFVNKLTRFLSQPTFLRKKRGYSAMAGAIEHFDWSKTADRWMGHIDEIENKGWNQPTDIHTPSLTIPNNLTNKEFVDWCVLNILNDVKKLNSWQVMRLIHNLNYGFSTDGGYDKGLNDLSLLGNPSMESFNQQKCVNQFLAIRETTNMWESRRAEKLGL